ncbi:MAG: hypothetical protein AB1782_00690 [Cyanobacteriota bacterium]
MRNNKYQVVIPAVLIFIVINIFLPAICNAYTATIDEFNTQNANQLLRVSLEPVKAKNEVNVYLFTSEKNPGLNKMDYDHDSYVIELFDSLIATTNNINLKKVSDLISNVRLVPFINTSNPAAPGMIKIIIDAKKSDIKYNVIVKPIQLSEEKPSQVSSKMYYPPSREPNQPQSMAFYTPLDNKTIAQLPPESKKDNLISQNPDVMPEVPRDDKLRVSPPNENTNLPAIDNKEVQNLPEIGTTVEPVANTSTNPTTPGQESQSSQPEPGVPNNQVQTVLPQEISKWLTVGCGFFIAVIITIAYAVVKEMRKAREKKAKQKKEGSPLPPPMPEASEEIDGLEPIDEIVVKEPIVQQIPHEPLIPPDLMEEETVNSISAPFGEEVEEVNLIDSVDINDNQSIYLVEVSGKFVLIGLINENVIVLNNFQPYELPKKNIVISLSKEGTIVGKDIYHIKIGNWEGVISSENDNISLHSNLTV